MDCRNRVVLSFDNTRVVGKLQHTINSQTYMTAKDLQTNFIKSYLKPTLKQRGYLTSGQTWWKSKGDFFIVINLQNSQWNTKETLSFCLNLGVALTATLKDPNKKKATYFDLSASSREDALLTHDRKLQKYRQGGWLGYVISDDTNLTEFINEFKVDLETHILPKLESLASLKDCVDFYEQPGFSSDFLKKQLSQLDLKL